MLGVAGTGHCRSGVLDRRFRARGLRDFDFEFQRFSFVLLSLELRDSLQLLPFVYLAQLEAF